MSGDAGDDTLDGGAGNDTLNGGYENDTYLWGVGSGQDTLNELRPSGADTLKLVGALAPTDLTLSRVGDDLLVKLRTGADQILIAKQFLADGVDRFEFTDGTVWNRGAILSQLLGLEPVVLTASADSFTGTAGNDTVSGMAGDDVILGSAGEDLIDGGEGNDLLHGEADQDFLMGGPGHDHLNGGGGNDTLSGGPGDDVLYTSSGFDFYQFGWDSGRERATVYYKEPSEPATGQTILLEPGILPSDVRLIREDRPWGSFENRLIIQLGNTSAQFGLPGYFYYVDAAGQPIDAGRTLTFQGLKFADGTIWTPSDMASRIIAPSATVKTVDTVDTVTVNSSWQLAEDQENLTAAAGKLDMLLVGNSSNNVITGNAGDNFLNMPADEVHAIRFGPQGIGLLNPYNFAFTRFTKAFGDDTLIGGAGDDVYWVNGMEYPGLGPWDQVMELLNEGEDTIFTTNVREALPENVENLVAIFGLTLCGGGYIRHYQGNELNNKIDVTNAVEAVHIDGGLGADTMYGSTWDGTTYVVDNAGDVVVERDLGAYHEEATSLGNPSAPDTIEASVSYTLPTLVERLTLTGSEAISATGNLQSNVLDGSQNAASNVLTGLGGDDTYIVGLGDVVVEAASGGTDTVVLEALPSGQVGPVKVSQWANVENLSFGFGITNSDMQGDDQANRLVGSLERNVIDGGDGDDTLVGFGPTAGYDISSSADPDSDWLIGGNGNDVILGVGLADTVEGGQGNDTITVGTISSSTIDAGAGNDTIGFASQSVYGVRGGSKVMLFGKGDGQDTILAQTLGSTQTKFNTLRLKADVLDTDVTVKKVGDDLEVWIGTGADKVTVKSFFVLPTADAVDISPIQQIEFEGGTVWSIDDILGMATGSYRPTVAVPVPDIKLSLGQAFSYTVPDGTFADANVGDVLTYSAGLYDSRTDVYPLPEWLSFDPATRTFSGTAPTEDEVFDFIELTATDRDGLQVSDVFNLTVVGPNKVVTGTSASNELLGGYGDDALSGLGGSDTLYGDIGNDTLDGGTGNDSLFGGYGDDVYLFGKGDGQDTVNEELSPFPGSEDQPIDNVLRFKPGVASSEVRLSQTGMDLVARIGTSTDRITVKGFFDPENADKPVQRIEFAGSEVWDVAQIVSLVTGVPINTAPKLVTPLTDQAAETGSALSFTVPAGAFTDTDVGDALTYSATLASGAALPSWLSFNPSTRVFSGTAPAALGTTSVKVVATDKAGLTVSDVFDVVVRAPENRVLLGTAADDSLAGGAGHDTLDGALGADAMSGGAGNDVYLVDNPGDTTVEAPDGGSDMVMASLSWTLGPEVETLWLTGTDHTSGTGNDADNTLMGNEGNNVLAGGLGNDLLQGHAGNDTLSGGLGEDVMMGGAGGDIYVVDHVADSITEEAGGGDDLVMSSIDWTLGSQLEMLWLTDGAVGGAVNGTGNELNNVLLGSTGHNVLSAGLGNDIVVGDAGDDVIEGGAGDDLIDSGLGNDVMLFGKGDGQDALIEGVPDATPGKLNVLRFKDGVDPSEVSFRRAGNDLEVLIGTGTDRVTVVGFYAGSGPLDSINPLQQIEFSGGASGEVWSLATIQAKAEAGAGALASPSALLTASTPERGADMLRHASGATPSIEPTPARARHHMLRHPMGAEQRDAEPMGAQAAMPGTTDITPGLNHSDTSWTQLMDMMAEMSGPQRTMHRATSGLETVHTSALGRVGLGVRLGVGERSETQWPQASDLGRPSPVPPSLVPPSDSSARIDSQIHQLINAMATFAPPAAGQTSLAGRPEPVLLQGDLAAGWR